jgi:hypothetical protein
MKRELNNTLTYEVLVVWFEKSPGTSYICAELHFERCARGKNPLWLWAMSQTLYCKPQDWKRKSIISQGWILGMLLAALTVELIRLKLLSGVVTTRAERYLLPNYL